jgi:lysozyme
MHTTTVKLIEIEEGFRERAYYCSENYPTIGIGQKIGKQGQPLSDFDLILVPKPVARAWLDCEIDDIYEKCKQFDWFGRLNQTRKDIIISICYQLGFSGFCKFKQTISYIEQGLFAEAAREMLDSRWHKQTPKRAERHSAVFASGGYDSVDYYGSIE